MTEEIISKVISNYVNIEGVAHNNELKASDLKKEIQQKGEDVKKDIDSIVAELIKNIDGILGQHNKEAGVVLVKLKDMETNLSAEIETLQQKLDNLNYENVVETSSGFTERNEIIPNYNKNITLNIDITKQIDLKNIVGNLTTGWISIFIYILKNF